jgi:hypothetical protein
MERNILQAAFQLEQIVELRQHQQEPQLAGPLLQTLHSGAARPPRWINISAPSPAESTARVPEIDHQASGPFGQLLHHLARGALQETQRESEDRCSGAASTFLLAEGNAISSSTTLLAYAGMPPVIATRAR